MSRIGKKPVDVLDGVKVSLDGSTLNVEGPKGKLQWQVHPEVTVTVDESGKSVVVSRSDDERTSRALHGLTRAVINNNGLRRQERVRKASGNPRRRLRLLDQRQEASTARRLCQRAQRRDSGRLEVTCPDQTHIVIKGCDKQLVGQFAAQVRSLRKPEPYKGKGIRYQGEVIKLKPGKSAT